MQKELQLRILSGLVLAAVVLLATWMGGLPFRLLSAAIALLIHYEWARITAARDSAPFLRAFGWLAQIAIAAAVLVDALPIALGLLLIALLLGLAFRAQGRASTWYPAGLLYAGLTGISLAGIRGSDLAGLHAMLFVFAIVWTTDTLAYFTGRAIGGPKLAPSISPGKTWSGAIGGALSAVVVAGLLAEMLQPGSLMRALPIALLLSVCSQIGDLFESFVKRRFGVKDSSYLIPGHGGVMDRVDGLIFACGAAFLLAGAFFTIKGGGDLSIGAALFGL